MLKHIIGRHKLSIKSLALISLTLIAPALSKAETIITEDGFTNPVEESIEYQLDKMRVSRTNGTLTILCWKAHEIEKAGMHEQGLPILIRCAEEGHDISMLELAKIYETGSGVKQDFKQAAMWLKKSSDRGFSTGQLYYGIALLTGQGVEQDIKAGRILIQKSAAQNDEMAKQLILSNYNIEEIIPDAAVDMSRKADKLY